jgi:hypothetical protein
VISFAGDRQLQKLVHLRSGVQGTSAAAAASTTADAEAVRALVSHQKPHFLKTTNVLLDCVENFIGKCF